MHESCWTIDVDRHDTRKGAFGDEKGIRAVTLWGMVEALMESDGDDLKEFYPFEVLKLGGLKDKPQVTPLAVFDEKPLDPDDRLTKKEKATDRTLFKGLVSKVKTLRSPITWDHATGVTDKLCVHLDDISHEGERMKYLALTTRSSQVSTTFGSTSQRGAEVTDRQRRGTPSL